MSELNLKKHISHGDDGFEKRQIEIRINSEPFDNLKYRDETILIMVYDPFTSKSNEDGSFILGTKEEYPKGISRMIGGGIENESPVNAATREIKEELNIKLEPKDLLPLVAFTVKALTTSEKVYGLLVYVMFLKLGSTNQMIPGDDISGIVRVSEDDIRILAKKLHYISENPICETNSIDGNTWSSFSEVYAQIMEQSLDILKQRALIKA